MMKVTLIAPEGLKEKYLRDAADEYIKRLRSFCDLKIAEFSPFKLPDKPSGSQIAAALDREAEQILKQAQGLFAGGELDEDAKDVFFQVCGKWFIYSHFNRIIRCTNCTNNQEHTNERHDSKYPVKYL